MKSIVIAITMIFSATAFASKANQSCNTYLTAASGNSSPQVRLALGLKALADAAELSLTPPQESNILSRVAKYISKNPGKQNDFEKMFYFACTTDLSPDEKEQIQDQLHAFETL
jgi:hypothetical protein